MTYAHPDPPMLPPAPARTRRGIPWWGWLLIVIAGVCLLSCVGVVGLLYYIGSRGPDTRVYTVQELPRQYLQILNDLKLLEAGEPLRFFYSDALIDVRDGLYFVTDRKVGIYRQDAAQPVTLVRFDDIEEAELERDTSFFTDSIITLRLINGEVMWFPVSSELNRDEAFFQAIRAPKASDTLPSQLPAETSVLPATMPD